MTDGFSNITLELPPADLLKFKVVLADVLKAKGNCPLQEYAKLLNEIEKLALSVKDYHSRLNALIDLKSILIDSPYKNEILQIEQKIIETKKAARMMSK